MFVNMYNPWFHDVSELSQQEHLQLDVWYI
jgi:hypothetical protein